MFLSIPLALGYLESQSGHEDTDNTSGGSANLEVAGSSGAGGIARRAGSGGGAVLISGVGASGWKLISIGVHRVCNT